MGAGVLVHALLLLGFILFPPPLAATACIFLISVTYEVIFFPLILEFGNTEGLQPGCGRTWSVTVRTVEPEPPLLSLAFPGFYSGRKYLCRLRLSPGPPRLLSQGS